MRIANLVAACFGVVLAVGLVGCGSTTSPETVRPATPTAAEAPAPSAPVVSATEVEPDASIMTVYRKKRVVGMALHASVHVDGTEIAELGNGTFVKVKVTPGQHRVWADEEDDALAASFEAGKTHYFRMELVPGLWKGNGRMVAVDEATGKQELAAWSPKPTTDVKVPAAVVH